MPPSSPDTTESFPEFHPQVWKYLDTLRVCETPQYDDPRLIDSATLKTTGNALALFTPDGWHHLGNYWSYRAMLELFEEKQYNARAEVERKTSDDFWTVQCRLFKFQE